MVLKVFLLVAMLNSVVLGAPLIVKDGQPLAEIIVATHPTRTAKLAASELQRFMKRMSGATLPISTEPTAAYPVKIYVGRSAATDLLNLHDEGFQYGAFRMVSGENWLALIGGDKDYVPPEPWPRNPNDSQEVARVTAEWDAKTGAKWGNPLTSESRLYSPLLDLWAPDGRGSINAVYHFLKTLGVRWYYPDETGLIVPAMSNIVLPSVDIVSKPDFPMRDFLFYYSEFFTARPGCEAMGDRIKWQLWLGLSSEVNVLGHTEGHGTMLAICRAEMKESHPDYYALYDGQRAVKFDGYGAPCLSSKGLQAENVKLLRAAFDVLHEPMFSVSPSDSYMLCGCDLCKGKDNPAGGFKGQLSDYVWTYVDRVAREVYRTHPDRKIQGIAYCPYQLPPDAVSRFSSNVVVGICQWRSLFYDKVEREYFRKLRRDWLKKLPRQTLFTWDYYLHGWENRSQWVNVPSFFPHLIAEDLKELKGISLGDHVDVGATLPGRMEEFGDVMSVNHLNAYVTAACLWDADTDVKALLDEYYRLYYGPAAKAMKTFIEYAEANWMNAPKDYQVIDRFFELIDSAKKDAGDSVYAVRIARLDKYMKPLTVLRNRLAKGRGNAPEIRVLGLVEGETVQLDGKLDEPFWKRLPEYGLADVVTGAAPQWGTSFRMAWSGDSLYIGIICRDSDTTNLNIKTHAPRSPAVWEGDCIELLLETQTHAYYQISVNPAGSMIEADRNMGVNTDWSSGAKVATHIGEGGWGVELCLPVAGEAAASLDARRGVAGKKPNMTYPWFGNVCRVRTRAQGRELSAALPTGKPDFHDTMKFGLIHVP